MFVGMLGLGGMLMGVVVCATLAVFVGMLGKCVEGSVGHKSHQGGNVSEFHLFLKSLGMKILKLNLSLHEILEALQIIHTARESFFASIGHGRQGNLTKGK